MMSVRNCLTLLGLFCWMALSTVAAPPDGKGGGGKGGGDDGGGNEPTPAGTIYFQWDSPTGAQTWGMDGDGNNMFQALPQGTFGYPSSLLYGSGHRWWLVTAEDGRVYDEVIRADGTILTDAPHQELFAVSWTLGGSLVWQPVCDSYGVFRFSPEQDGQFNGPRPNGGFLSQWSSDGLDTFAYAVGSDISATFIENEDGTTTLDLSRPYNPRAMCRIDVPDGSMTLGQSVEAGIELGPEAVTILDGQWGGSNLTEFQFAPDGLTVLQEVEVYDDGLGGWVLEHDLRDATTGVTLWTAPINARQSARWSPLGGEIALSLSGNDEGIWVMPADETGYGTPVPLFPLDGKYNDATDPRWSPDAGHLVFSQKLWKKGAYRTHLYRIKSDGSGVIQLTGDLDDARKWPFRWTSNVVAP